MFMMNKKRKRTLAAAVAIVLCFGLLVSAVAGYFSGIGYNYSPQPINSSTPAAK